MFGGVGYNVVFGDGVDVLMGGGCNYWMLFDLVLNKCGCVDGCNLFDEMKVKGYMVVVIWD